MPPPPPLALLMLLPSLADVPDAAASTLGEPVLERAAITGGWWGLRSTIEDHGLLIGAEYVAEFSGVLDGGRSERGSFRNLLTLDASLDLDAAFGIEGGTFFAQYLSVNAESGGSRDVGDLQVYSNIESGRSLDVLYELWYQQLLFDRRLRIKVGKVDANSEFAYVGVAGDFANSSAGFSPTILGFPSYPDPAMSVNAFVTLGEPDALALTLGYGFYDGALGADGVPTGRPGPASFFSDDRSGDYTHGAQAELTWDALDPSPEARWWKQGRFSFGGWWHTGEFDRPDGGTDDGVGGLFLTVEQRVFASGRTDDAGVYLFGQYARTDDASSEIARHLAGGVVVHGTFPGRDTDRAGVYVSLAELSDAPGAGSGDDELIIDAYYRLRVTPAVFVQPELQYIVNPAADPDARDALVAGLRVGIVF